MLQPVAFYDEAIAQLMTAAGQEFVQCLPEYDRVDSTVCRWQPQQPRFRGPDLALANFVAAMLGDSDAYISVLLAALRFLMCGIQEDAGVTLSAGEVATMLGSQPLCDQVRRVPFPTGRHSWGLRFGQPHGQGHNFVHLLVQVSSVPSAKAQLVVSVHGRGIADPNRLLGVLAERMIPYVIVAESFTPIPDDLDLVRSIVQVFDVPNEHMTPSILDLDFELRVCTRRLQGAGDRIARTVLAGITYTCITPNERIGRGPAYARLTGWAVVSNAMFSFPRPPRPPDDPDDH
jgi:hypothetical protein